MAVTCAGLMRGSCDLPDWGVLGGGCHTQQMRSLIRVRLFHTVSHQASRWLTPSMTAHVQTHPDTRPHGVFICCVSDARHVHAPPPTSSFLVGAAPTEFSHSLVPSLVRLLLSSAVFAGASASLCVCCASCTSESEWSLGCKAGDNEGWRIQWREKQQQCGYIA